MSRRAHLRGKLTAFGIACIAVLVWMAVGPPPRPVTAQRPTQPATGPEIASFRGFEEGGSGVPAGWIRDKRRTGNEGSVSVDRSRAHSGGASLKLAPNKRNGGAFPLAVAQVIPAANYRGRRVEFSGFVFTEGASNPGLGMLNFVGSRGSNLVVAPAEGGAGWVKFSAVYDIPDDSSVQLVLTCMVTGQSGAAWFDDLSVRLYEAKPGASAAPPAGSSSSPAPASNSAPVEHATISVDAAKVLREIPRTLYGTNVEWIWNGNLLWDEGRRRPDPTLVQLTKELGVTLIRFPGGHFSDFYHWREAVGPYDKRPEMRHEPGKNDESRPFFGTDEALEFARTVNGELFITVNAGTGTAQEAADWVRYVNRSGRGEQVRYWEIGNELYTKDASPISKASAIDPATYASRALEFAHAMRAVDPEIRIGAIGGENYGLYRTITYRDWDKTVLEKAGGIIDFLAIHNAYAPIVLAKDEHKDVRTIYSAMLASPQLIARNLETVTKQLEEYAPSRKIAIAVTEWGPAFQFDPRSRYVDHVKSLGSALFAASALKAFIDSPRTKIANFFLLNDLSVLGWIGSSNNDLPPKPQWTPTARYLALQLFTRHFGSRLIQSNAQGPTYDSPEVGFVAAVQNVPYLDVLASLSDDGRRLFLIGINRHFDDSIEADIDIHGFRPAAEATAWTVTGTGIDANTGTKPLNVPGAHWARQAEARQNPRFSSGGPQEVVESSSAVPKVSGHFRYRFPPHSVTSLVLSAEGGR